MRARASIILFALLLLSGLLAVPAMAGSSYPINYQGKLAGKDGAPANGSFAMEFKLYDAATGGNQIGSSCSLSDVKITNGLFSVALSFPEASFNGSPRYLETTVGGETLSERTAINWAPSAIYAETAGSANSVDWAGVTGAPTALSPSGLAGGSLVGYYPSPGIADSSVGNAQLARDADSLERVSSGVLRVRNLGHIGFGINDPQGPLDVRAGTIQDILVQSTGGYKTGAPDWSQSFIAPQNGYLTSIVIYASSRTGLPWVGRLTVYDDYGAVLTSQLATGRYNSDTAEVVLNNPAPIYLGGIYSFRLETIDIVDVVLGGPDPYKNGLFSVGTTNYGDYDAKFVLKARVGVDPQLTVAPDATYSSYNVGIGTKYPEVKLHVAVPKTLGYPSVWLGGASDQNTNLKFATSSSTGYLNEIQSSNVGVSGGASIVINPDGGNVGVKKVPSSSYRLQVLGTVAGKTAYVNLSDGRYKTNILPLANALDKVLQLRGVSYNWDRAKHPELNLPSKRQVGFIAQEVQKVLPEAVSKDDKGTLSIAYSAVTPLLIEAFKEQQRQLDQQNQELVKLNLENEQLLAKCAEMDALRSQIMAIQARLNRSNGSTRVAKSR